MADIDTVLERLVADPGFRHQLATDPAAALAGYELDANDRELLTRALDGEAGILHAVEQRTSKSATLGLLASLPGTGAARGSGGYNDLVTDDTPGREAAAAVDGQQVDGGLAVAPGGDAELGRALGLRHEHTRPESAPDADFLTVDDT